MTNKVIPQIMEVNRDGIVHVASRLSIPHLKSLQKNGSWPYFAGNKPATEPTVICSIACRDDDAICEGALNFLMSIRNADGGWSSGEGLGESDWNTGLALFGITRLSTELKARKKLSADLEQKTSTVYKESISKLAALRADILPGWGRTIMTAVSGPDFDYARGWPWEQNTWHWVEPTAYSLMAIKSGPMAGEERYAKAIEQAHKYLYEKICKGGGWNWGQTRTLGYDFPAVPRDTALAVLALQDQKGTDNVNNALKILRNATSGSAGGVDPLVILALDAFGEDVSQIAETFVQDYKPPEYSDENLVSLGYGAMVAGLSGGTSNGLRLA